MSTLSDWMRPSEWTTDPSCGDCYGLGYDGGGAVCACTVEIRPAQPERD